MTTITAKVIADSIGPESPQLTTLQLRYPKCIHGEFMTHRVFSRNASSSRAIPVERLIKDVMEDPYIPVHWGKNQRGMQASEECNERVRTFYFDHVDGESWTNEKAWLKARDNAVAMAQAFADAGYHKQIVNRLIEPWCHINVVVTATEWTNFFALRDHTDAQPEIQMLARAMKKAMAESKPRLLKPGEWHLPYVEPLEEDRAMSAYDRTGDALKQAWKMATKVSVARCARVSYLTQEGKIPSISEDLALYDKLISSVPLHASPAEHQATPDEWLINHNFGMGAWFKPELHGNLQGWVQYRKTLPGECQ